MPFNRLLLADKVTCITPSSPYEAITDLTAGHKGRGQRRRKSESLLASLPAQYRNL